MGFLYIVTALSSCLGGLVLISTFIGSKSAPQEAAGAAIAISLAVIPYVFSRCVQITSDAKESKRRHDQMLVALANRQVAADAPAPEVERKSWA